MKTRFIGRDGVSTNIEFSLCEIQFFEVFFFAGEQRRLFFTLITEQNFEKRFRTRLTAHLADKEHLKGSYRAEF